MTSGRAATGISDLVVGVSHLECWVEDVDRCVDTLAPLGFAPVGRFEEGGGRLRVVAVEAGDVHLLLTEPAEVGGARGLVDAQVVDVALLVRDVDAAQQLAEARGGLPVGRDRGRVEPPGPAIAGPGSLVHSLVGPGQWLRGGAPDPDLEASGRTEPPAATTVRAVRVAVDDEQIDEWRSYYRELLGDGAGAPPERGEGLTLGPTRLEVGGYDATRGYGVLERVDRVVLGGDKTAVEHVLADGGVATRSTAEGAIELSALSSLMGAAVVLAVAP